MAHDQMAPSFAQLLQNDDLVSLPLSGCGAAWQASLILLRRNGGMKNYHQESIGLHAEVEAPLKNCGRKWRRLLL